MGRRASRCATPRPRSANLSATLRCGSGSSSSDGGGGRRQCTQCARSAAYLDLTHVAAAPRVLVSIHGAPAPALTDDAIISWRDVCHFKLAGTRELGIRISAMQLIINGAPSLACGRERLPAARAGAVYLRYL
jgi:hypothetical protein